MENEVLFKSVLIEDEEVKKVYKPSKMRYIYLSLVGVLPVLFIELGVIVLATLLLTGVIPLIDASTGKQDSALAIILYVMAGIPILVIFIILLIRIASFRNTYYAITNKRAIIRTGFTVVNYRNLNLDLVKDIDLYAGALDNMAKPKTGVVIFGMSDDSSRRHVRYDKNRHFAFTAVENPEEVKKEIKGLLDNNN